MEKIVTVHASKINGIEASPVNVEVGVNPGIGIHLVGLADVSVKESLLRTVTALQASGFRIPGKKIVINLAPADQRKSGSRYDLAIAVGIVAASGQKDLPDLNKYLLSAELGLDGSLRPVSGSVQTAEMANESGLIALMPESNAREAAAFYPQNVIPVGTLSDALNVIAGGAPSIVLKDAESFYNEIPDLASVPGNLAAKRGLEIAAAGGFGVTLIGEPGSGKAQLARAFAGILPPMNVEETLVTNKIYSAASHTFGYTVRKRPVRAPHCSSSMASWLGGGSGEDICPGEISLAHNGVLVIDEFTALPKAVREFLSRHDRKEGVTISRLKSKTTFPTNFIPVLTDLPCPCGYYGQGDRCTCTKGQMQARWNALSTPQLMDTAPVRCFVRNEYGKSTETGDGSAKVAERVAASRELQKKLFERTDYKLVSEIPSRDLEKFIPVEGEAFVLMEKLCNSGLISPQDFSHVRRIALAIATLDGRAQVCNADIAEAASFRFRLPGMQAD